MLAWAWEAAACAAQVAAAVVAERRVTLRDKFHNPLAILDVEVGDPLGPAACIQARTSTFSRSCGVRTACAHACARVTRAWQESWEADKSLEARSVYGTVDPTHPAVAYLDSGTGNSTTITCVGATVAQSRDAHRADYGAPCATWLPCGQCSDRSHAPPRAIEMRQSGGSMAHALWSMCRARCGKLRRSRQHAPCGIAI